MPSQAEAVGNCYPVAFHLVHDEAQDYLICHGWPIGQGPIEGERHGHAWVETPDGFVAIDFSNGKQVTAPRERFYEIGQIKEHEVKRYTLREASRHLIESGHYGPWEEG